LLGAVDPTLSTAAATDATAAAAAADVRLFLSVRFASGSVSQVQADASQVITDCWTAAAAAAVGASVTPLLLPLAVVLP
jgi:hypothetical protein